MKLENWHIIKDSDNKHHLYYFGEEDLDNFEEEFGEPYDENKEIPFEVWNSDDITLVLESMMEDCNMHRYLYWPRLVLDSLIDSNIGEFERKSIMKNILNEMLVLHLN